MTEFNKDIDILHSEIDKLQSINGEFRRVFENYNDGTMYICDSNGNTLWAGNDVANNCGVSREYLMSHTVAELEAARIFYPSVSSMVLKSKKTEAVTQITSTGKTGIAIGIPIFNSRDEMVQVISLTKDLNSVLKLGRLLSAAGDSVPTVNGCLKNIVIGSPASVNLYNAIKNIAAVNASVWIYGERGSGRNTAAEFITKGNVFKMSCGNTAASKHESIIFGTATQKGLIEKAQGGTLYIGNVDAMSKKCQRQLLEYIKKSGNIRIIFSSISAPTDIMQDNTVLKQIAATLSMVQLHIPSLSERREDIPLLIKHFTVEANKRLGTSKCFAADAVTALETYTYRSNIRELRDIVEYAAAASQQAIIQLEDLPDEVKLSLNIHSANYSHLADAVAALEKNMICSALKRYGTLTSAAKALGVNQSTVSRKVKRYGIKI